MCRPLCSAQLLCSVQLHRHMCACSILTCTYSAGPASSLGEAHRLPHQPNHRGRARRGGRSAAHSFAQGPTQPVCRLAATSDEKRHHCGCHCAHPARTALQAGLVSPALAKKLKMKLLVACSQQLPSELRPASLQAGGNE